MADLFSLRSGHFGDDEAECDADHHGGDEPQVLCPAALDKVLRQEPDGPDRYRSENNEPPEPRFLRQPHGPDAACAREAASRAVKDDIPMVAHERYRDIPNIRRKINEHRDQRPQLHDGHRRRDHLRVPVVKVRQPRRKHHMRRRADRNKLGQSLNNAENDGLEKIHNDVVQKRECE